MAESPLDKYKAELVNQIQVLYNRRKWIDNRIEELETELETLPDRPIGLGGHDPLKVRASDIRGHIKVWCDLHSIKQLSIRAGVDYKTITNILDGTWEYTTFGVADRLMTAMGLMQYVSELQTYDSRPKPPVSKFYEE